MASYQQLNYCKVCKKNVALNEEGKCANCFSSQIKKSWTVRFRVLELSGEKQKRLTGYETKKAAQNGYIEYITSKPQLKPNNDSQSFIFEDVLKQYFSTYQIENEQSTIYNKKQAFARYITPYFKKKDVRHLSKSELQSWQDRLWITKSERTKENLSWKYLTKIRGFLFNFLEYCKNLYDIPNPLAHIRIPRNMDTKKEMVFWEIETFNKFIGTVDDIMWKTLWSVFMFTGARFNEARALSDSDIKDKRVYITKALPRKNSSVHSIKPTKNKKNVIKQIPDVLDSQIKEYKKWKMENGISSTFLFGGDIPLAETTIRRRFCADIKKAKVQYINPHGFRHSYVSLLIHLGISTKIIAELIGDNEIQVIKTYGHLYTNAKDEAICILNDSIKAVNI